MTEDASDGESAERERVTGTFLVAEADEAGDGAVLMDAERGRVHTVADAGDLAADEALTGELVEAGAMGAVWRVAETERRWTIQTGESDEPPTRNARESASDEVGDLVRVERAGEGELHLITVPEDGTEQAVADVLADEQGLRARAARLGVARVEVRSAPGVVSVRYLP
ncbi:MAG: DUF5812 family protein [Haloferacaceae archaeon]